MDRKVLEKVALNKYERYLMNRPAHKPFSDPRLQRAHANLIKAKRQDKMGKALLELNKTPNPAADKAIQRHALDRDALIKKNRGKLYTAGKTKVMSPFANTGDVSAHKNYTSTLKKMDELSLNNLQLKKNPLLYRASKYIAKHPVKSGLLGLGMAGLTGAAAYGIKKDLEDN